MKYFLTNLIYSNFAEEKTNILTYETTNYFIGSVADGNGCHGADQPGAWCHDSGKFG